MTHFEEMGNRWVELFNKKDLGGLVALYSEQCVNTQPHLPQPVKGKKATEEDLSGFFKAFPDGHMVANHTSISGDTLAMEWTFTGTQNGPVVSPGGTIPPSGKHVSIKGAEFIRIDGQGLIVDERGYFDLVSFMKQLGAMPEPSGERS
jgi:steroid delta-isomerase-like uncharacterized protein